MSMQDQLRDQLEDIEHLFDAQERVIENLKAQLNAAANGAPVPKAIAEPLREFDTVADLVAFVAESGWERGPHTADSFMLKVAATGRDTRPWKQYIVKELGCRVYRAPYSTQSPDWYQIAHRRIVDVAGHVGKNGQRYCIAMTQEGDDAWESDEADMIELVKKYGGGLNRPFESWQRHDRGKKLAVAYLETHDDPGGEYTQRNPNTLGYANNNW